MVLLAAAVKLTAPALWRAITPAAPLPMFTAPVLLPVFMLVMLLELLFRLTVPPEIVLPPVMLSPPAVTVRHLLRWFHHQWLQLDLFRLFQW
jgi:hypothetical protein